MKTTGYFSSHGLKSMSRKISIKSLCEKLCVLWLSLSKPLIFWLGIQAFLSGCVDNPSSTVRTPQSLNQATPQNGDASPTNPNINVDPELLEEVQTLLTQYCASCHSPENPLGNFDHVNDLTRMVEEGKYVVPGDPEASILYRRMAPEGNMPPAGPLDKNLSDKVANWIRALEVVNPLESQALAVLDQHCASCHNPNNPQGGFGFIKDVPRMIESGRYLIPGQPETSLIFSILAPQGTMPPSGEIPVEARNILRDWIISLEQQQRDPLSDDMLLNLIRQDIEQNVSQAQRRFVRYFSLQNVYNRGFSSTKLETISSALGKTLNSFSRSRDIIIPTPIDEGKRIFRVNLSEFAIDPQRFDAVMNDFYPFLPRFIPINNNNLSLILSANDDFNRNALQSEFYVLRADWFVATATLPVLYERLLNLPLTQTELEQSLGIASLQNIQQDLVVRSGFKNSNVSSQNRVIERHQSSVSGLPYWASYDFAANGGDQNIFDFPLGPVGIGFDQKSFIHDGGEFIFQLPNGMFAYYLANNLGAAIHRGPQSIVRNDNGPRQLLGNIMNGISCMTCHGKGLLNQNDEIRNFATASTNFTQDEKNKIFSLYVDPVMFKQYLDTDNKLYFEALRKLSIDPFKPEVVELSFGHYHQDLNRLDVMRELQIDGKQLDLLLSLEPLKSRWVSIQKEDGWLSREEFNLFYAQAQALINTGIQVKTPVIGDYIPTPQCLGDADLVLNDCVNQVVVVP